MWRALGCSTYCKLVARVDAFGTDENIHVTDIEDLEEVIGLEIELENGIKNGIYQRWFTGVVQVEQIAVQVQMRAFARLHRRVCRAIGRRAWRKRELGKDSERRERDFRNALGAVFCFVDNEL